MPVVFKIRSKHKTKNSMINDITKYLDVSHNNSNNMSSNNSLQKYIELQINNTSNLEHIYDNIQTIDRIGTNNSSKSDMNGSTYETPNSKIQIKVGSFIGKGSFGNVYNATLINNTTQQSVLLDKFDDLSIRLSNIHQLDVIVKSQLIKRGHSNNITKILTEYLIHLLLNYNTKTSRFIPRLYCVYKHRNTILFVMEKLNGQTLDQFISYSKKTNKNSDIIQNNYNQKFIDCFKQIAMILFMLQKYYKFSHGDLKPNNIILVPTTKSYITINGEKIKTHGVLVKIIDFGFSCIQTESGNNIIVPGTIYNNNICNKQFVDLLFLIIRVVRKSFAYKYNVPANFKKECRILVEQLLKIVGLKHHDNLIIGENDITSDSQSNIAVINKSKSKIEYRIVLGISDKYNSFKHKKELLAFTPKEIFKMLNRL